MAAALGGRVAGRAASRGPGRRRAGTQGGRAGSAAPRGLGGGLAERELRELLLLLPLPGPRAAPAPSSSLSPSLSWAWPCVVSDLSGSCVLDCRERLAVACGAAAGRAESETPEADALGSSASPPYPPIPEGPRSRGPPPLPAPPPRSLSSALWLHASLCLATWVLNHQLPCLLSTWEEEGGRGTGPGALSLTGTGQPSQRCCTHTPHGPAFGPWAPPWETGQENSEPGLTALRVTSGLSNRHTSSLGQDVCLFWGKE